MDNKERIQQIDIETEALMAKIQKIEDTSIGNKESFDEYMSKAQPYYNKVNKLSREKRLIEEPTFSPLSDYGDLMSIDQFIAACKAGMFIDYDGFGHYVRGDQESDIVVYPSDVQYGSIRKDFDKVNWFNK